MAASRAKLTMLNTMSKIRGQVKNPGYPQSEGLLGECMIRYGKELGEDSNFGEWTPGSRWGEWGRPLIHLRGVTLNSGRGWVNFVPPNGWRGAQKGFRDLQGEQIQREREEV